MVDTDMKVASIADKKHNIFSQFRSIFIPYKVGTRVFDIVDQCIAQEKQPIFPYKDRTSHSQFGVSWCALNVAKFRSNTKSLIFKRISGVNIIINWMRKLLPRKIQLSVGKVKIYTMRLYNFNMSSSCILLSQNN